MKKYLFLAVLGLSTFACSAQTRKIDTVAVSILDRMSSMLSSFNSCTVKVASNYDIRNQDLGLVKHSESDQLFLHGHDKLMVSASGDKGSRQYFYDGQNLTYYSQDKNQFSEMKAPARTLEMIDTAFKKYGIEFPAADFFYSGFVDDIIGESRQLVYLGITKVGERECFHIAGITKDKAYQFWISNDAYTLPLRMVIVYTTKEMNPQYEAVLSDWQINPDLPDRLFQFHAPPKARRIKLFAHTK